jgi:hypothetical protein
MTETTEATTFNGGIDIDGVAYTCEISKSEEHSGDDYGPLVDVTIVIPALEPWAADRIMRAVSLDFEQAVPE